MDCRFMTVDKTDIITPSEFGKLFSEYRARFAAVARSYVRDADVAEDLVIDSFVSFWENRETIEITQSVPAYILASVKRRCLNWLRDQNTHLKAQQNIHSLAQRIITQRIATLETSDPDAVFAAEVSAIIEKEVGKMPEKMRDIFIASRFEDKTYKEIADIFGLSVNQVDFEMRKATKILRDALKDYLPILTAISVFGIHL